MDFWWGSTKFRIDYDEVGSNVASSLWKNAWKIPRWVLKPQVISHAMLQARLKRIAGAVLDLAVFGQNGSKIKKIEISPKWWDFT